MSDVTTACPRCKTGRVGQHCEQRVCGWLRCRARLCGAVMDPRRRRGHVVTAGKTVFFDPLAPSP